MYRHKQLPASENRRTAGDTAAAAPSAGPSAGEEGACQEEGIRNKTQPSSKLDTAIDKKSDLSQDSKKLMPLKAGPPVHILDPSGPQTFAHTYALAIQSQQPSEVPQTTLNSHSVPQQSAQSSTNIIQVPFYSADLPKMRSLTEAGTVTYGPMMHSLLSVLPTQTVPHNVQTVSSNSGPEIGQPVVTQGSQEPHTHTSHYEASSI